MMHEAIEERSDHHHVAQERDQSSTGRLDVTIVDAFRGGHDHVGEFVAGVGGRRKKRSSMSRSSAAAAGRGTFRARRVPALR